MEPTNWQDIYVQLYAFTDKCIKAHSWFRSGQIDSFLKGKQVHDYVAEAIEQHLSAPQKYDPTSGRSLANYLKYHIIRRLVSNDSKSAENTTSSELRPIVVQEGDDEDNYGFDELLPGAHAFFDQELDYDAVLKEVKLALASDETAEFIFEQVRLNGLNRRDVIKEYKMQDAVFDNGMKRLNTVLKKVAQKFQLVSKKEQYE